ncbi:hypothetical protein Pan153_36600 [Gimesia panareensis]|uniref:Uncharacterized protein n=1 Tax=Gimesia panareensis TaxID=2527978 RepID=A0A518FRM8_9PLAN|nr:hypothetical protein [Gimesia panareensis]QDV18999.1 hypothetical protein Pan153_36600 [Gimesia panareensis]
MSQDSALTDSPPQQPAGSHQRWVSFLLVTGALCLFWFVALPRIARVPSVRAKIEHLEQQKIDPSAMYYTDLEKIEDTVRQIDDFHREHPDALW